MSGARGGAAGELKALMLAEPGLTLAAAESLTCGRVQARIGEASGASNYFLGGITAYSLEQKVRHLGVARAAARKVESVADFVAEQMALGACELFGADIGVATTGYAEPSREAEVAAPFAWWAVAHVRQRRGGKGTGATTVVALRSGRVECPGATRVDAQAMVADAAIAEAIAYLREWRGGR